MLEAGTLERLVYLRLMLSEAQQRAKDRTHTGRHLAAIQLDGACEHAMMLAVGELHETPAKTFHQNFALLKKFLAGDWAPDGWSGVNCLHGTRTEAQHRGTVPDAAEFTRWSADAERFINSLVAAAFGVDLQTVATAQAVETSAVRELLQRAEAALADENFSDSFRASVDALNEARGLWGIERRDALGATAFKPPPSEDLAPQDVRQAVERMNDLAAIEPFAPDVGEYIWLRSVASLLWQNVPVTRDDAERALSFVVGWVLRWEAFSHRYTKDRLGEWRRGHGPQTTADPDAKPSIRVVSADAVQSPQLADETRFALSFEVVDIPECGSGFWLQELNMQLRAQWQARTPALSATSFPITDEVGIVRVHGVSDKAESERAGTVIKASVDATHQRWQDSLAEFEASKLDLVDAEARFANAVSAITFEGKPLVVETKASASLAGRGADRRFFATVAMRLSLAGDLSLRHQLWKALHGSGELAPGGNAPLNLVGETLVAPATMPPERVREVLATAASEAEAERQSAREKRARDEATAESIAEAARAGLVG